MRRFSPVATAVATIHAAGVSLGACAQTWLSSTSSTHEVDETARTPLVSLRNRSVPKRLSMVKRLFGVITSRQSMTFVHSVTVA
jgi:hypothetical protein